MKTATLLVLGFGISLAACNRGPEVHEENASVDEVTAKVREATGGKQFIRAGEWQSTGKIEELTIPGLPPEQATRMKEAMAKSGMHEFNTCLTEEDVKQPQGKFFTGSDDCRYDHFTMSGGKIDAAMRCTPAGGGTQIMTMKGTYSPDSYSMQMDMKSAGAPGQPGSMTMRMRVDSKRIGACKPGAQAAAN